MEPINQRGSSVHPELVHSFRLKLDDLITLYHKREISTIRAYLAKKEDKQAGTYGECELIWVPVDEKGKEIHQVNYESTFFLGDKESGRGKAFSCNIPAEQAMSWIENWRSFIIPYNEGSDPQHPTLVYSFKINMEDFLTLHLEKGITSIRMYLGKDEKGHCKMFWVPLDEENKSLTGTEGQAITFDFSKACPPDCDDIDVEGWPIWPGISALQGSK